MLLSIVTINYNNASGLQKTMQSVFAQNLHDCEYLIIDGGSTDQSRLYIQEHAEKLAYWVSEKDKGIYHAMNKGILQSKGEYLLFLNSGDELHSADSINSVLTHLGDADIIYGNLLIVEPLKKWIKYYNEKLSFEYFTRDTLPHQGAFIKRDLFQQMGLYDEDLKLVADWKFFVQAVCIYTVSTLFVDVIVANYDYSGLTARPEFYALQAEEKRKVLNNLFPLYIDSIDELHELRQKKEFYDSFEKDFIVQKYFGLKLRWKTLIKSLKK